MKMYSVVHFLNDNTVEAIPSKWQNKKNSTSAWPKNTNLAIKYIEQNINPTENDFNYFKSRELSKNIVSLIEARKKAEKAKYLSDLSADEDKIHRKYKMKKVPYSPTSSTTSSCPIFSNNEYTLDNRSPKIKSNSVNKNKKFPKQKKQNGWSPSPKKSKNSTKDNYTAYFKNKSPINDMLIQKSYNIEEQKLSTSSPKEYVSKGFVSEPLSKFIYNSDIINQNNNKKSPNLSSSSQNTINITKGTEKNPVSRRLSFSPQNKNVGSNSIDTISKNKLYSSSSSLIRKQSPNLIDTEFKIQTLRMLTYLINEVKFLVSSQSELIKIIEEGSNRSTNHAEFNSVLSDLTDCSLPINNVTDLDVLEDKIAGDKTFRNTLINELTFIGGKSIKLMVKRIMSKLFTDTYTTCSIFLYGQKGQKQIFKSDDLLCYF